MSVLVFISHKKEISKNAQEACSYARKIDEEVIVVTYGDISDEDLTSLGTFGVSKVLVNRSLTNPDDSQMANLVSAAVSHTASKIMIFSHDLIGKSVAPLVSGKLKAGMISGAISLPDTGAGFTVERPVFSGKAFASVSIDTDIKIVSLMPNSFPAEENAATVSIESFDADAGEAKVKITGTKMQEGDIALPDAEKVVSAGRGLKGPENWGMIEELASVLGAATACSRPVADIGWRPHHEHVGQTGVAIRPNLYIAIGISGAIQHLAGVNASKTIVVINTDAEAPFFKAADYGIVGDAFEVVPKLIEAIKQL
ncbi:MAG: electron transfer flavoprotein alpha subunit [Patiriisocius sp.]|jgi:electron transfer flavoprotein alpha subunit